MSNPTLAERARDHHDLPDGLSERPLSIPTTYFCDDRGWALFDTICDLPEYYLTRSERGLLDQRSGEIASLTEAKEVVERGAGTARKTRHLIKSRLESSSDLHDAPVDISRYALELAEDSLSREFPELSIGGIECDYTKNLEALDPDPGCLAVFLGSTIGNFTHDCGVASSALCVCTEDGTGGGCV
jgi:L-histidine N-alpha-methyltransferase